MRRPVLVRRPDSGSQFSFRPPIRTSWQRASIREWLSSGEAEKIVATATLLRGFTHSVVFGEHELIAEIIAAASRCGSECLDDTKGELFALAVSGVTAGRRASPLRGTYKTRRTRAT